tara:strand:- start:1687 stop:2466 length:780 start_codon:yes stop_codon:yes gene_type:complete
VAIGTCKLCFKEKDLKKSHAIANSIFKRILRPANGKAILLSNGDEKIAYTSDSWAEEQLCGECEGLLSRKYEKYSLEVLRGRRGTIINHPTSDYYQNVQVKELILFFLSIYWRGAHSSHKSYHALNISFSNNMLLREAILNNTNVLLSKYAVRVYKLIDSTGSANDFESKVFKNFIASPYVKNPSVLHSRVTICFAFEGFYIEIIEGGVKFKERSTIGALNANEESMRIKHICLFDIPQLVEIMGKSLDKQRAGHTLIK